MNSNSKTYISMLMGVIILVADAIWTYQSYYDTFWLALGAIILVADIIWLLVDYSFIAKK